MQADRMEAGRSGHDFKRTLVIAGLAFMLVGSLAFIAMSGSRTAPEARSQLPEAVSTPNPVAALPEVAPQSAPVVEAVTAPAVVEEPEVVALAEPEALPVPDLGDTASGPSTGIIDTEIATEAPLEALASVATPLPACFTDLTDLAQKSTIYFQTGSVSLNGDHLTKLANLGRMAQACPDAIIQVTGHSDTTGDDLVNLNLSWQRADNTVTALAQIGLSTVQFQPVGLGARAPVAEGDTSDEELNRRVEFVVVQADTAE